MCKVARNDLNSSAEKLIYGISLGLSIAYFDELNVLYVALREEPVPQEYLCQKYTAAIGHYDNKSVWILKLQV